MIKYHKIETVFERSEENKKLIWGKYRNPTFEYLKNNEWIFTEKVDGTNIRVYWDGHNVQFGGRTEKAEIPNHLLDKLNSLFGGNVNEEMFEQRFGEKEVILFGEGYGEKIQTNGYIDGVDFILFDVMISGNYQPRAVVEEIASYFSISVVPIALTGTLEAGIQYVSNNPNSIINCSRKMEGIVGHPVVDLNTRTGERVIVKLKYEDLKEFGEIMKIRMHYKNNMTETLILPKSWIEDIKAAVEGGYTYFDNVNNYGVHGENITYIERVYD